MGSMRKFGATGSRSALHAAWIVVFAAVTWLSAPTDAASTTSAAPAGNAQIRLSGHVLPGLTLASAATSADSAAPLNLTIVLKRDDESGFQQYLQDVYDPASTTFRHFLTQGQLSDRFGPSGAAYEQVLAYLKAQGFEFVQGSANRLTLLVRGTRAVTERAFAVHITDYQRGNAPFYANDTDPAVPAELAAHVQSVSGLSNLATPHRVTQTDLDNFCNAVGIAAGIGIPFTAGAAIPFAFAAAAGCFLANLFLLDFNAMNATPGSGYQNPFGPTPPAPIAPAGINSVGAKQSSATPNAGGTGQTIGLLEFDTFQTSDVTDFLNLVRLVGATPGQIGNLSQVHVNGGAALGAGQEEVLLDIDTVMTVAPGATVVVYDAPLTTSYQAMFNAMINGGVTVISNSWASCEDQVSLAEVQGIDTILQSAAASGISVFNGAGDSGSTCLDGSPNTISVPADSPHATAVGGTSLSAGPGFTYGSETWWNGTNATPLTGQGGFGVSRFFTRPSYQNGLNASSMRSIPDVVFNADPAHGFSICQASAGGCPTGLFYGGTSLSAPFWAGFTALLNQTQGNNLGGLNPLIYPLANTGAFHNAASMGSDFAHVGLGSPNHDVLHVLLSGQAVGIADAGNSGTVYAAAKFSGTQIPAVARIPADGASAGIIVASLLDANGNSVSGKSVSLAANAGSHAVITPASGVSSVANGTVVFSVTDLTAETLSFTATDTTDGVVLQHAASITFGVPPAASASITALSGVAAADGVSSDTVTVALQDSLGRPTPGKLIVLSHTGSSVTQGPTPAVTNSSGQIQFIVTDTVQETVTYTAVDATDDNLPIPGSAVVTFNYSGGDNCGNTNTGNPDFSAGPGYAITPFAAGFVPLISNFGGLNNGCRGASGLAFDVTGNLYVSDFHSGNIYLFGAAGGVAGPSTLITPVPLGPGIQSLAFGQDGKLYGGQLATTGNFFTGAVIEINPVTGALVRTVASSITCAGFLVTDPVSGDLFIDDTCSGGGSENGSIWRISNPGSASPLTTVYASTPGINGGMSFAPGGTLYTISYRDNGGAGGVVRVSGTNSPSPGQISVLPGLTSPYLGLVASGSQINGDAQSITMAHLPGTDGFPRGIRSIDITTNPVTTTSVVMNNAFANVQAVGPDGCQYASVATAVYKITNADGSCPLTIDNPSLSINPAAVSPNPMLGAVQTFTATFHHETVAPGTPVFFDISGANAQFKMSSTNAAGQATLSYSGVNTGKDTIIAFATVNAVTLTSNPAQVTWDAGPHTTLLSFNNSATAANAGEPVTLKATLVDVSVSPAAPVVGATIQFSVAGKSCSGVTSASGLASCSVTVASIGAFTLTATYAGAASFLPATASKIFSSADLIFANGFEPLL